MKSDQILFFLDLFFILLNSSIFSVKIAIGIKNWH